MRCGNCKQDHPDAQSVRECYVNAGKVRETAPPVATKEGPMWPPSEPQVAYVLGLQEQRELPAEYDKQTANQLRKMERDEVSRRIGELKALPSKVPTGRGRVQYNMPAGRYAVWHQEREEWWFFQVDKPTEGRWDGYTFIKRLIGAPGSYRKIELRASERMGWLAAIEADPNKAMTAYGMESGVCGRCSSPLTDPQSLARGIGPICIGKLGW